MKNIARILASLALFLLPACSSSPSSGSGSGSGGDAVGISIPSTNESAPSGVLEQLTWAGAGGGPEGYCPLAGCSQYWQGSSLFLRGFAANQELVLLFYRNTGGDACGNSTADYATGYVVQVDSEGYLEVKISGMDSDVFLYQIRDAETWDLMRGAPLGGQYPC